MVMPDREQTTRQIQMLGSEKFKDPKLTADGSPRASVSLKRLRTLWFNTGTLCNIACDNCYIESSPTNNRLAYISSADVHQYLEEIGRDNWPVEEIGVTGGEPFMNPEIIEILEQCLSGEFSVLVLTNAMKPLAHKKDQLLDLKRRFGGRLTFRISIDHYTQENHESLRGPRSWLPMRQGLTWLAENGFSINAAGRSCWAETEPLLRDGYAKLFADWGVNIDAEDPVQLVIFPEMDPLADVPEITTACWGILGVSPDAMMCATSRMVTKRRGEIAPIVMPCTLLADDAEFEMGETLATADQTVQLNHPHCARFCVLGGGACSIG